MRKTWAVAAVLVAFSSPAFADVALGKMAKEAGFADAAKCTYCHSGMPKKGDADKKLNGRGQFLVDQKAAKKADKYDMAWLKDYKEPAKK